ncbi:MAG TPA: ATP-dependent DNA helicase [Gammaproteobacteria bacterium]|nr:ATP-dependent DNA helicase [Gammaproteobacteria bacterium]
MPDLSELLGIEGPLAGALPDFAPREQQQQLAAAVAHALDDMGVLVAEAGTGTGKTFAYLLPALLAGKRVLISTGTKTLQDQLYHRDLPALRAAVGMPVKTALLKGRANYLCRQRLGLTAEQGLFDSRARLKELEALRQWAAVTRSGDISELTTIPEDSTLWAQVTSTADNCLGQECPEYSRCHVVEARRAAQEADLVVVNHHLLLADMVLKEEGFGELLPGVDAVIVDEAHQLPEIATQYFSTSVSTRQLADWLQDVRKEYAGAAGDLPDFEARLAALEQALAALRPAFAEGGGRQEWAHLPNREMLAERLRAVRSALEDLKPVLDGLAGRSRGLESCRERATVLGLRLAAFLDEDTGAEVRWIEHFGRQVAFNLTPLDASERFATRMHETPCAWVFLSATLSIAGEFRHFRERLGVAEAEELLLGSPFDFENHALLYLPPRMPATDSPAFTAAVVEAARPVIEASGGRAFLLFTSHRALKQAADILRGELDYPLLVQGEMPRRRLLEAFRELGNAVLLGTASFWEGVDVKGPALSVVVIDKLPFASPGDPVLKARLELMRGEGRNPFMEFQLPQAVLALKQGVGRLIRDAHDTGVLVICDPRLTGKPYGRVFLESLPPMRRTRDIKEVTRFLHEHLGEASEAAAG